MTDPKKTLPEGASFFCVRSFLRLRVREIFTIVILEEKKDLLRKVK